MCLAIRRKLFMMNLIDSTKCDKCIGNKEETQIHMFYECDYIKPLYIWVLRCLVNCCNFKPSSNIRFIFFDTSYNTDHQRIICNTFVYIYVITVWRMRKENLRIGDLKFIFIRKLNDYKMFLKHIQNRKFEKVSLALSAIDTDTLLDL